MPSSQALLDAIVSTFAVILLGYVLRRTNFLTAEYSKGLSFLTSKLALPAVLFLSMATLDFQNVDWYLVLGVNLGKLVTFGGVFLLSCLFESFRAGSLSNASMRAIFVTQCSEFSIGLPVLKALYPASIVQYLYLIAPVQLLLFNPLGFLVIETDLARLQSSVSSSSVSPSKQSGNFARVRRILLSVFLNPIILFTFLGLAFNFMVKHNPPGFIREFLNIIGNAYSVCSLLTLGGSLVNRLSAKDRKELLVPVLLVIAKIIFSPIVTKLILQKLGSMKATVNSVVYDLTVFGFIYGSIPTSSRVFVFASDYGILVAEMATGVALCTLLSGPVMYAASVMAQLSTNQNDLEEFDELVKACVYNIGIVSIIAVIWVMIAYGYSVYLKIESHGRLLIGPIAVFVLLYHVSAQLCRVDLSYPWDRVRFILTVGSLCAVRIISAFAGAYLYFAQVKAPIVARKFATIFSILSIVLIIVFDSLFGAFSKPLKSQEFSFDDCWTFYSPENKSTVVLGFTVNLLTLCMLVFVMVKLALLYRAESAIRAQNKSNDRSVMRIRSSTDNNNNVDDNNSLRKTGCEKVPGPSSTERSLSEPLLLESSPDHGSFDVRQSKASVDLFDADQEELRRDDEPLSSFSFQDEEKEDLALVMNPNHNLIIYDVNFDEEIDHRAVNVGPAADHSLSLDPPSTFKNATASSRLKQRISYRDILFLVYQTLSASIGTLVYLWNLAISTSSGFYLEIVFLDLVLLCIQGIALAVIFTTKRSIISPFQRIWQRLFGSLAAKLRRFGERRFNLLVVPESKLDASQKKARERFLPFLQEFKERYVGNVAVGLRQYYSVFRGSDLVEFLVEKHLSLDGEEAEVMGKNLLVARVIHHVTSKLHFIGKFEYLFQLNDMLCDN